jgi:2-polyprenyl-3-methyl-5-hydroxy-6-metoxy-1,4-benzoquinol methylase
VNGLKYAANILRTTLRARLHQLGVFFDRKFDVNSPEETYDLKLGYESSHTAAIAAARPGSHILDVGCGQGLVAAELMKRGCRVTGMDRYPPPTPLDTPARPKFIRWDLDRKEFPVNVSQFDQIFLLDIIEHLKAPEEFMDELRYATGCKRPELVITTANIGFMATRLMLFFGQFNYGKRGILDATHTRLFTFRSMRELLEQTGYKIVEMRGIPAPFPKALGNNWFARLLVRLNAGFIRLSAGLFSYQVFARAQALPTVNNLLTETIDTSAKLRETALADLFENVDGAQQSLGN